MDPFNYLHLESEGLDIRGSQIAVLFQYDSAKRATTTEKRLQSEMGSLQSKTGDMNTEVSRALHTMVAHLHRYGSELGWFEGIVADLSAHHDRFFQTQSGRANKAETSAGQRLSVGLVHIAAQLKAVNTFRQELQYKTQNILALLFNNIQVSNDKMVVELLNASREEAELSRRIADQSQQIALEMQEDSISMKT
ncbi:hypothetical protein SLS61_008087, partial [Didymella pomorum]